MKYFKILIILIATTFFNDALSLESYTLKSPNAKISVDVWITSAGDAFYSISHLGSTILKQSKLGMIRSDDDFSTNLTLDSVSDVKIVSDKYTLLHGKRLKCTYTGNNRVFYLKNSNFKKIEMIFQASNDGVAFRYYFPGKSDTTLRIYKEVTTYHFDISTIAFLQPCPDARMGWCFSSPSYEEYYSMNKAVGTNSPYQAGWVLPALFNYGKYWICITETAVDTNYCGSRLSQFSPDGEYSVQFPQPQECRSNEPVLPESLLPWHTPWRVIALTDNMADLF